jgi:hypothetical protein
MDEHALPSVALATPDPASTSTPSSAGGALLLVDDRKTLPLVARPLPHHSAGGAFGKYQLLEEIARGGMGIIYKARDTVLDRVVALKMIRWGADARPEDISRFLREAQAAEQLDHPNLIPVFEIDQVGGQHYFTMPFVPSGSLRDHLERIGANRKGAVALVEKVARAVHHAHERGVLHRDLKPANVLLDERDEPLVSDFGLAKLADASVELTQTGQQLGTPAYMAPEQASGQSGRVTAATDVWALGVLLYELLTGRRPFLGPGRAELFRQILSDETPPPRVFQPALDIALETVVLKCLEKEPRRRYASAKALADDLARWQHGKRVRARRLGWAGRLARLAARRPLLTAAVLLIACASAAGPTLLPHSPSPAAPTPLEVAVDRLIHGEEATLLGPTGSPVGSNWVVGGSAAQMTAAPDKPFAIESWTLGLLELLPDPQRTSYRLRGEIQHDQSDLHGEVGVYLARRRTLIQGGEIDSFLQFAFNDIHDTSEGVKNLPAQLRATIVPGNRATFDLRVYCEANPALRHRHSGRASQPFPPAGFLRSDWRPFWIEVTPRGVRAAWGEEPLADLTTKELAAHVQTVLKGKPALDAALPERAGGAKIEFPPRGGLGLLIYNGSASFRNVAIEPLNEEP